MGLFWEQNAQQLVCKAYDSREEMGVAAAEDAARRLRLLIRRKGFASVVFAAAPSQNEFLKHLIEADVQWNNVIAFHMDEYIGLSADAPQGFGNFLKEAIFSRLPFRQVNYLDGQAKDAQAECARYTALLNENPPDIVFLGIGENGHLAFNDPGVADFTDAHTVKVVELDNVCRNQQVNDGCFRHIDEVPVTAFTLTMSAIMRIPQALSIVPGPTKANAVYHTVNAPVSAQCPATVLREHKDAVLYIDRDSAARLV